MTNDIAPKRKRRMAPEMPADKAAKPAVPKSPSKLDQMEQMLTCEEGASIAEMVQTTGWQQHSVRGAMAGSLKKRGLTISSEKIDGVRRYRAEPAA